MSIMDGYKRVQTSAEVWAVIRARHPEMVVFGSYSAPEGDPYGDSTKGQMATSYGFEGCDYPLIEAKTTWDIVEDYKRNNVKHEYWLCLPISGNKE